MNEGPGWVSLPDQKARFSPAYGVFHSVQNTLEVHIILHYSWNERELITYLAFVESESQYCS